MPALVRFDPAQLVLKQVGSRWQLWSARQFVKDFGLHEHEAGEALRLIRDLHFTQYGVVDGSSPPFEFWLCDEEPCKRGLGAKSVISFNRRMLRAEEVTGAWVIHDDKQLLYNFGKQQESAVQALTVLKKYNFNSVGAIGGPTPAMTYLLVDPYNHVNPPLTQPDMKDLLFKLSQKGLMLPNVGYVGSRMPIDCRRLEALRIQGEWVVVNGKDVLGRFGGDPVLARDALHLLQDAHVTDMCLIGKSGFPIFLSNGQAPRQVGLGFNNIRVQTAQLKLQTINGVICLTEGARIIIEFGDNRTDAELALKLFQHFQIDQICPLGDPAHGGIRLLMRSK
jgi:hypothetical protein